VNSNISETISGGMLWIGDGASSRFRISEPGEAVSSCGFSRSVWRGACKRSADASARENLLNRRNIDKFDSGTTVGGQDNPGIKSKGKSDQLAQGEDKGGATGVMAARCK
jgi:hypothetical protein